MPTLNQIIAVDKSIKNQSNLEITAAYHDAQKPELFTGLSRTYAPVDVDGEKHPPENKKVQRRGQELLAITASTMTKYWDSALTKDSANCEARADVVVDGVVVYKQAPVTFLLFLEKQLGDLTNLLKKIPVLDPGETWSFNDAQNCFATEPTQSARSKKVTKVSIVVPPTAQHPAQTRDLSEDVVAGYWTAIKYSGALPQARIAQLLERAGKLQSAVKFAREEANSIRVSTLSIGKAAFAYLLA